MTVKINEFMRKCAVAVFALAPFAVLFAAPVSTDLAGMAVRSWLQAGNGLGMGRRDAIGYVKAFSTSSGASFNVVYLPDGGFVVTSSDTEIEPIIAFSGDSEFVEGQKNPLWVMLGRDLAARARNRKP